MPKGNVYQWNYKKLDRLTGGIKEFVSKPENYKKIKNEPFMDLVIECIGENIISLAHYYEQGGDLIPDPDMEIKVMPEFEAVEVLAYQDNFKYQKVYTEDGKSYYPKLRKELNSFLNFWLNNLKKQGFYK